MATIKEIAERLNVSPAAVSIGLRGGRGVGKETARKIQEAAEEMGYSKPQASSVGKSIGLIVTTQLDGDLFELARRHVLVINEELAKRGWRSFPVRIPGTGEDGERILADFIENGGVNGVRVDGCLMLGRLPSPLLPRFHHFLAESFLGNIVMLCNHDVANGLSGVTMMDYNAGIQAAQTLTNIGHRNIGWIGSLGSENNASERLGGVHTALRKVGCTLSHEIWLNDREMLPNAEVGRLISSKLPSNRADWPTAWVCSTDWLAAKLIVWAKSEKIRVPKDMSVVAFDNTQVAEHLAEMVITSVVFPYEEIARKSIQLLEQQLESSGQEAIVWSLPHQMRKGVTVAPLTQGGAKTRSASAKKAIRKG